MNLTTDIFAQDFFSLLGIGIPLIVVGLVLMLIGGFTMDGSDHDDRQASVGAVIFCIGLILAVVFFIMFIVDMVRMDGLTDERGEALKMELIAEGYNNIIDLELDHYSSADKTEFSYIENNNVVDCQIVGAGSKTEYKVVCFD